MREQRDLFLPINESGPESRPSDEPDELDRLFMEHLPLLEPPSHLIEQVLTTIARFPDLHRPPEHATGSSAG
jgi:hypothetical protein